MVPYYPLYNALNNQMIHITPNSDHTTRLVINTYCSQYFIQAEAQGVVYLRVEQAQSKQGQVALSIHSRFTR